MAAIALVLERHPAAVGERCQRREDLRELPLDLVIQRRQPFRNQARDVVVQRIEENREREAALELRCRSPENQVAPGLGPSGELLEEPGLADPRLPRQLDRAPMASVELVQDPLERTKLIRTPDQVPGNQRQTSCFARSGGAGKPWAHFSVVGIPVTSSPTLRAVNPGGQGRLAP